MSLLRTIQFTSPPSCPCHSHAGGHGARHGPVQAASRLGQLAHQRAATLRRGYATPQETPPSEPSGLKEYAFEMASSSIRFGPGVTQEVGMDLRNMGAQRVCVVTDPTVDKLFAMQQVREALTREEVAFEVYSGTAVEPKDSS